MDVKLVQTLVFLFDSDCCITENNSLIGFARNLIGWGSKPQITGDDDIKNFRRRNFLWGQRCRRMKDQKLWPGLALNQNFVRERA